MTFDGEWAEVSHNQARTWCRNSTQDAIQENGPAWKVAIMSSSIPEFTVKALSVVGFSLLAACSINFELNQHANMEEKIEIERVFNEILIKSEKSYSNLIAEYPESVDTEIQNIAKQHFIRALEIVDLNVDEYLKTNEPYNISRHLQILERNVIPKLTIVRSDSIFAKAFPDGHVVVSESFAGSFVNSEMHSYDSAYLGVLIHELLHVRDGHAALQWMTSDIRPYYLKDRSLNFLSAISSVIPGLNLYYSKRYNSNYESGNELPDLSEFAADLGTVVLLDKQGLDPNTYVRFLRRINSQSMEFYSIDTNSKSLLAKRIECLDFMRNPTPIKFDVVSLKYLVRSFDFDTMEATEHIFINESVASINTSVDKRIGRNTQLLLFVTCAASNIFQPSIFDKDKHLTTPIFDIDLFYKYQETKIE